MANSQIQGSFQRTVADARDGDARAVGLVLRHIHGDVHRLVHRVLVGFEADAEEAVQDALYKVARALGTFEPSGAATLRTWALKIALRTALDKQRSNRRAQRRLAVVEAWTTDTASSSAVESGPARVQRLQLSRAVKDAAAELSEDLRTVLVLRAFHDLDYDEIAEICDVPVGTVKSRLSRARTQLRATLEASP